MEGGPVRGPDELVAGSDHAPPRRRPGLWLLALLVAGVVLGVVRPELSLHAERPADRPTASPDDGAQDRIGWRPRGDLAEDEDFVSEAIVRVGIERRDATRLFFAGRLPGGNRLALVGTGVGSPESPPVTRVYALLVPPREDIFAGRVSEVSVLSDLEPVLSWAARGSDGRVLALAMARPGPVRFEVSSRVQFGADGTAARVSTPSYAEDGVIVLDLGRQVDPVITVRALGAGFSSVQQVTRVSRPAPVNQLLQVEGIVTGTYRGPDTPYLSHALRAGAGTVADLDASRLELLWSATLPRARKLALVLVTRPDGQRFQALVGQQDDSEFQAGVRPLPRGASDQLPWLFTPPTPEDATLLLCPTGPGSLVYRRAGQPDHVLPIDASGVAGLIVPGSSPPSASGATVLLRDPDGRVLLRTTLPEPGFDDPLALD